MITAVIAFIVAKNIIRSRVELTGQAAQMKAESAYKSEQARLESDLRHSKERQEELLGQIEAVKKDCEKILEQTKFDLHKRYTDEIAAREKAHKEAMDSLELRFNETMAKVTAQVKSDTADMLKAQQKEFSESSNLSIGQIVNPLKENIVELKKAMEEGNKEMAERNGEMRERIKTLMEHSDAARKSADDLAAAFKHGNKIQGDWGETILEELLATNGLTKGIHFDTQSVIRGKDGKVIKNEDGSTMRPDVILHLDERREVIIDSKVSLTPRSH